MEPALLAPSSKGESKKIMLSSRLDIIETPILLIFDVIFYPSKIVLYATDKMDVSCETRVKFPRLLHVFDTVKTHTEAKGHNVDTCVQGFDVQHIAWDS